MELNEISVASPLGVCNMSQDLNFSNLKILEEGPRMMAQELNTDGSSPKEIKQNAQDLNMKYLQILEEGPRICPICSQEVRSYFINYDEKIEMCENLECDYPFAYEPVQIFREDNGMQSDSDRDTQSLGDAKTITSMITPSVGFSQASVNWSDVNKLCASFVPGSPRMDCDQVKTTSQSKKAEESQRRKQELLSNVEKIKQMTKSMNEMNRPQSKQIIRNEKWIRNLQYLQGLSGRNLLKPEEMKNIKKKPDPVEGELKIDSIDKNNLLNIKIELNHAMRSHSEPV